MNKMIKIIFSYKEINFNSLSNRNKTQFNCYKCPYSTK